MVTVFLCPRFASPFTSPYPGQRFVRLGPIDQNAKVRFIVNHTIQLGKVQVDETFRCQGRPLDSLTVDAGFKGDQTMMKAAVLLAVAAGFSVAQIQPTALAGAWRIEEDITTGSVARTIKDPQPGLYLFTGKHYSMLYIDSGNPRPETKPGSSDSELVASWRPVQAQSGTYEISGTTLTVHPVVAKETGAMTPGSYFKYSFKLEGSTLELTQIGSSRGPAAHPWTRRFKRIE